MTPQDGPAPYPGMPTGSTAPLTCPKCRGAMRTYERNGLHIDQCETCRGIFLDFGELEHLGQLEGRMSQPVPAAPPPQQMPQPGYYNGPGWGQHGGYHYRKGGLSRLFFSS